ncbi:hypothetical protein I79_023781 [Cricetulus griseus]|uniref:Uncharacterized protein n=1 Tax=Cricetulus griseus TaxID=10029 RepID=G3IIV3_CRIGR|nr:hypothetical protein I79_023781 [Cricetulus griseus]
MTSDEETHVRRLVQQHHKKGFVHGVGLGERDKCLCYMITVKVHPGDTGWERNNCSEPNPRADMTQPDGKRYLEVVHQQLIVENIPIWPAHREEAWVPCTLPTPLRKRESPSSNSCLISRRPSGPPRILSVDSMCVHRLAF